MKKSYFISGTDTGIGKTVSCAVLLRALSDEKDVGYFKPVQTGEDSDTRTIQRLSEVQVASPVYSFLEPLAPAQAAEREAREIHLSVIQKAWKDLQERFPDCRWIVEGAGGLLVPLNRKHFILDLVQVLELPLILVASTRLGTMNHTLLSVEAAQSRGVPIRGLIFVGEDKPEVIEWITHFSKLPVLAKIPYLPHLEPKDIYENAAHWVKRELL